MSLTTRLVVLIYIAFALTTFACAKVETPACPSSIETSITKVDTNRVNASIVRVIQHNMELAPQLELELMSAPEFQILDTLKIKSISLGDELLDFENSSGVYVDTVNFSDTHVEVVFEYYPLEGESFMVSCVVKPQKTAFEPIACTKP